MPSPHPHLPAHCALVEYATYDSTLLLGDFLRRALLFVYADTAVLVYKPHAQRSLAFRLLARSDHLSRRFLWLRLKGIRQPVSAGDTSVVTAPAAHSREVKTLASAVRQSCRAEIAGLARVLRSENPEFDLNASWLGPLALAQALEDCLGAVSMSAIERGIVFDAWSGLFSLAMKNTYDKYLRVLAQKDDIPSPLPPDPDAQAAWRPIPSFVAAASP